MRRSLAADCARCAALCCSLPFVRGQEFPEDKPDERPCRHVGGDHRCGIHDRLWADGWRGCVAFDCFGAGQQVVQVTYAGAREVDPAERLTVFGVMRQLHEMRFLLADRACAQSSYAQAADALDDELAALAEQDPSTLLTVDLPDLRRRAGEIFSRVAAEAGGVSLRGAVLIAADLRGEDLRHADLLGADLRAADVRGVDLSSALFVSQPQVSAARGDAGTRLPDRLTAPHHWAG